VISFLWAFNAWSLSKFTFIELCSIFNTLRCLVILSPREEKG
jgi:hypothetical protein